MHAKFSFITIALLAIQMTFLWPELNLNTPNWLLYTWIPNLLINRSDYFIGISNRHGHWAYALTCRQIKGMINTFVRFIQFDCTLKNLRIYQRTISLHSFEFWLNLYTLIKLWNLMFICHYCMWLLTPTWPIK